MIPDSIVWIKGSRQLLGDLSLLLPKAQMNCVSW